MNKEEIRSIISELNKEKEIKNKEEEADAIRMTCKCISLWGYFTKELYSFSKRSLEVRKYIRQVQDMGFTVKLVYISKMAASDYYSYMLKLTFPMEE